MKRKSIPVTRNRSRGFFGIGGAAAVEFAITAPVLVVLVLGIADYGVLMGKFSFPRRRYPRRGGGRQGKPERHTGATHRPEPFSGRDHAHRRVRSHLHRQ